MQVLEIALIKDDEVPAEQPVQPEMEVAPKTDDQVPAEQEMQLVDDEAGLDEDHVPCAQLVQDDAPAVAQVPKAQVKQELEDVAPPAVEKVPAGHEEQAAAALLDHDPLVQETQDERDVDAARVENVPDWHATQTDCNVAVLVEDHVPALQAEQMAPFNHEPRGQSLLQSVAPSAETPLGQVKHVKTEVAPEAIEYVPALQLVHEAAEDCDHDPGTQAPHTLT